MKPQIASIGLAAMTLLWACSPAAEPPAVAAEAALPQGSEAGGLIITNARIIDGLGGVIERGAVAVRAGTIVEVSETAESPPGAVAIDAGGMTVMPGFIDGHRHIIRGDPEQWMSEQAGPQMQDLIEAGFTTVMSCGDPLEEILELRRRLESGSIRGPRLLTVGWIPLARPAGPPPTVDPARAESSWAPRTTAAAIPADDTRAAMQAFKDAGVDAVKNVMMVTPQGPETGTLRLVVAEGRRLGLPVVTHAVTVEDTLAAVAAGVSSLVHTPVDGAMSEEQARAIGRAGIPMMSTLGVFVPFFSADNEALFRDGTPFPWERLYHAGEGAVNARRLWNAGITLGFGTDTAFGVAADRRHRDLLAHEIRSLSLVFSPQDIVTIMARNSGAAVGLDTQIGTLEPGKAADLVLLDGDPLSDSSALLNVRMVIRDGEIVVDQR